MLDEVEEFVTGRPAAPVRERLLATVLFTDIVRSTEHAAELGDRRWRELLAQHDRVVERELARHRGRMVKSFGDAVFATFDGPARAVRCALAIREAAPAIGLELRAGIHTGECEVVGERPRRGSRSTSPRACRRPRGRARSSPRARSRTSSSAPASSSRTAGRTCSRASRASGRSTRSPGTPSARSRRPPRRRAAAAERSERYCRSPASAVARPAGADAGTGSGTGAAAPCSNSRATLARLGSGSSAVAIRVTTPHAAM